MCSNICFDLVVSYQYHLKDTRPHVEIIEDNEIEVSQQAFNQLRNTNNTNTQNNQNIQNDFNIKTMSFLIQKILIKWKLISFIKLTLEQIQNKITEQREDREGVEMRARRGEEGCRSTNPSF
jgi:hypothetical protein